MMKPRLLTSLAVAGLLVAAACGDDSEGGDGIASLDGTGAADESAGGEDGEASREDLQDAMIEFAGCMREHGIDMPDPQVDDEGRVMIGGGPGSGGGGSLADDPAFAEADEACRHLMEDVAGQGQGLSPEEQAEMQDKLTEMAQCMRDRGHDMPDPQLDGGRAQVGQAEAGGGPEVDFDDDEFQADMAECQDEAGLDGPGFGRSTASGSGDDR